MAKEFVVKIKKKFSNGGFQRVEYTSRKYGCIWEDQRIIINIYIALFFEVTQSAALHAIVKSMNTFQNTEKYTAVEMDNLVSSNK